MRRCVSSPDQRLTSDDPIVVNVVPAGTFTRELKTVFSSVTRTIWLKDPAEVGKELSTTMLPAAPMAGTAGMGIVAVLVEDVYEGPTRQAEGTPEVMSMVKLLEADWLVESATCTLMVEVLAEVGVPEMVPAADSINPDGKEEPETRDHV